MADRFASLPDRRAIIDRRALWDVLVELGTGGQSATQKRATLAVLLGDALASGHRGLEQRAQRFAE